MDTTDNKAPSIYQQIYTVVRLIPVGRVTSYGQVATIVGSCTPRVVGYAMASLPNGSDVPWHRVINSQGKISQHKRGDGSTRQRVLLESEGVEFDQRDKVDLDRFGWAGPDLAWLDEHNLV